MKLKKIFCAIKDSMEETTPVGSYSSLLGLNRNFNFILSKSKVADDKEFNMIANEAEASLRHDLKRFGEDLEIVPPMFRNKLIGSIGSMTLLADDSGNLSIKFHRRDDDGLWDGISKKYPEKDTTAKYKHEIFFALDDEEEDE